MADTAQTPIIITAETVAAAALHRYVAFASDLGLKPGEWPAALDTDMGNKLRFVRDRVTSLKAVYVQCAGCLTLTVLND